MYSILLMRCRSCCFVFYPYNFVGFSANSVVYFVMSCFCVQRLSFFVVISNYDSIEERKKKTAHKAGVCASGASMDTNNQDAVLDPRDGNRWQGEWHQENGTRGGDEDYWGDEEMDKAGGGGEPEEEEVWDEGAEEEEVWGEG